MFYIDSFYPITDLTRFQSLLSIFLILFSELISSLLRLVCSSLSCYLTYQIRLSFIWLSFRWCNLFVSSSILLVNSKVIIIQQLMRRKKEDSQMMQQAIQKASQLIELLQRENGDLKRKVDRLEKQNKTLHKQFREVNQKMQRMEREAQTSRQNLLLKQNEVQKLKIANQICDQQLKKKISTNKQLHQKISNLTARLKQKSKDSNEDKTKLLSLQNQNQYLLNKLKQYDEKQSIAVKKVHSIVFQREMELKEVIKLKQAFARRCEQLKADNAALLQAAAQYKQRVVQGSIQNNNVDLYHTVKVAKKQPCSISVQNILSKIIKQNLGVQPESTIQRQAQQLGSFIQYRLGHLEKLWQGMLSKLQEKQWRKIENLKDLYTACQRMHSYLTELLKQKE